tara:strand:+ start:1135 stop:1482 length:348 start_codon:yes stop_codon:yes gene_type:complete
MKTYYFIKISNNNNPSVDFMVDFTMMYNTNLRMCVIKSQLKAYRNNILKNARYKPVWHYIEATDYSYYKIDTQDFEEYQDAKAHALKLYNYEFTKMNNPHTPHIISTDKHIVSFR